MADKLLFPNAIDYIRTINNNLVDNALGRRSGFLLLPSLYQRAYAVVHETGELPLTENLVAPDESITKDSQNQVNILTSED
jgi:hypothetical protein